MPKQWEHWFARLLQVIWVSVFLFVTIKAVVAPGKRTTYTGYA